MAKSKKRIANNLGGNKKQFLTETLRGADLEKTMIVPIDIAKSSHKALVADYFGTIWHGSFEFHNSPEGMAHLHRVVSHVSAEHQAQRTLVALEATGHYGKHTALGLHALGYHHLFVLNPLITKKVREAGLTWSKTDEQDLCAIGQSLLNGYATPYRLELPLWQDLKALCRFRRFQVHRETAVKNKLHAFYDQLLPGLSELSMFRDDLLWHPAAVEFCSKYPNVTDVSRLRPQALAEFFQRRQRRLTAEDPYDLLRWSRETFRQEITASSTQESLLKKLLTELQTLQEQRLALEVDLLDFLVQTPAVLLLSIHWLGPLRAAEFAGEIAPLAQYPNSRALLKGAGLDSTTRQSAQREAPDHPISKEGSARLRYISVQIGEALMNHNDHFRQGAQRFLDRGDSKSYACVVTACRFLRIAHAMLKEQQPFRPASGLGITPDPLSKIAEFLQDRKASDRLEEYTAHARRFFQFPASSGKGGCIPESPSLRETD